MDGTSLGIGEPARRPERPSGLRRRRLAFLTLVLTTIAVATGAFLSVFAADGLSAVDLVMTALFALTLPWIVIGFWNALIGWVLLQRQGGSLRGLVPLNGLDDDGAPVTARTALVMTLFNEDPAEGFRRLRATLASLDATGEGDHFAAFILSDTSDPDVAAAEEDLFVAWQREDERPERLHYRRRARNTGYKAGNIQDFCRRWGSNFDYFVTLDIDSVMSGATLLRLVRLMQLNPELGILQTLIAGLPAFSPFPRIFQFGMRHGMRAYTYGSIWWQGDAGPYWGHNAIVRIRAFRTHCRLKPLPGDGPLAGHILSHDLLEAVLMRRAGYHVRVLPIEDGSYEENPPTLPDFMKRDLRWCHGNLQYLHLLGMPGLRRIGRVQLLLAILMYTSSPCWLLLLALGFGQAMAGSLGMTAPSLSPLTAGPLLPAIGWSLFAATIVFSLAPKLFGWLDTLANREKLRAFGGAPIFLVGIVVELLASTLLAPVLALAQTLFIASLVFGRRMTWKAQMRGRRALPLATALRLLWPQTVVGVAMSAALLATVPGLAAFASPLLIGLVLAAPLASLTADPRVGHWLGRHRICAIPEELAPPPEVCAVIDLPRATPETGAQPFEARGSAASGLAASDPPEAAG